MDFTLKQPMHLFAALLLGITLLLLIITPILSILGFYPTTADIPLTELIILISALITIILLIGTPLLWYTLVNKSKPQEILHHLKLNAKNLPNTIFWAFIAITIMYAALIIIGIILMAIGYNTTEITNIEELANNLTLGSVLFIVLFQSTSEEIFFRGFLFNKITTISNQRIAIIATALLFGIAHLSYGKIYPAIMTTIFGIILGTIVIKSHNLLSAILAHILYNATSFALFFIIQTYNIQAIML
jgi:membrane protease YdiL (CAAX protease family)